MIELINKITGTKMWVADERLDEYLEAGHKLASENCAKPDEESSDRLKKPTKRTTKKK